jgi:hypothetical protein
MTLYTFAIDTAFLRPTHQVRTCMPLHREHMISRTIAHYQTEGKSHAAWWSRCEAQ